MTQTDDATVGDNPDICPLCRQSSDLVVSHVIPAFVFRWLKETSITGHLRNATTPNRRIQDGLKYRWLCTTCEQRLSGYEAYFSSNIFHPYSGGTEVLRYGPDLMKFCCSVSWRVLCHHVRESGLSDWPSHMRAEAFRALDRWREVILDNLPHPGGFEQHLIPMAEITEATANLPNNANRYLLRVIDMDLAGNSTTAFTYAKMGKFMLFGMIASGPDRWRGGRVSPTAGTVGPKQYTMPKALLGYLSDRMKAVNEAVEAVSDIQQEKMENLLLSNLDRARSSEQFKAMLADEKMFGPEAIIRRPKSDK